MRRPLLLERRTGPGNKRRENRGMMAMTTSKFYQRESRFLGQRPFTNIQDNDTGYCSRGHWRIIVVALGQRRHVVDNDALPESLQAATNLEWSSHVVG